MITHDLGVVASMCDRIAIMYAGQIVEEGTVDEIFYEPHHPYTKGLLNSINNSAKDNDEPLAPIPGTPPDLLKLPKGCAFMSRCPYTMKICEVQASPVTTYSETHCCRCWLECMDETKSQFPGRRRRWRTLWQVAIFILICSSTAETEGSGAVRIKSRKCTDRSRIECDDRYDRTDLSGRWR